GKPKGVGIPGRLSSRLGSHGVSRIPGIAPGLRLHEAPDAYGRPFAFVSTTAGGLHAVLIEYAGEGAPQPGESVGAWVARWENVIAELRASPVLGISVTTELTRPRVLRFALTYTEAGQPASTGRRRRVGVPDMAVRIGSQLPRICTLLEANAGGRAAPLSAASVTYGVRATFDPSVAELVGDSGPRPALRWRDVAPTTVREAWDHVVHDRATSVTWAMSGLPGDEPAAALLGPAPELANARLQVFFRRATRPTAHQDGLATALTATSTAPADEAVAALDALPDRLSQQTRWGLRRVYGGQAAAFAATAGLGIAVPGQLKPPQVVAAR
ncbi:MAG TPA: SCO6880 family protein, partial [Yinghuangia sp.]|nr:SCO6880 family protein [Yinghuangia sp.]